MFGLVKASTLRQAESDLRAACKRRDANAKVRDEFVTIARDTAEERDNWFAIAESRLVAVLLLRDRWRAIDLAGQMMQEALNAANAESAERREQLQTAIANTTQYAVERDAAKTQVKELAAKWEAAVAASALNAEAVNAAKDALTKFHDDLTAISSIAFTLQPEIETAIIRPSSTNRLRWRVNDDDGKALCQSSTGYATPEDAAAAFARAAFLISIDHRAPEDDRITRIRKC